MRTSIGFPIGSVDLFDVWITENRVVKVVSAGLDVVRLIVDIIMKINSIWRVGLSAAGAGRAVRVGRAGIESIHAADATTPTDIVPSVNRIQ
jgi:hypothetical protein